MYAYMTPHELKDFVAQHAVLGDGLFGVCPATQVDEGVKYNIYVSRDGMVRVVLKVFSLRQTHVFVWLWVLDGSWDLQGDRGEKGCLCVRVRVRVRV